MRYFLAFSVSLLLILSVRVAQAQSDGTSTVLSKDSAYDRNVIKGIQYDSRFVDKKLRKQDQKLTVFGYYRLFLFGRHLTEPYPNLNPFEKAYSVGDGYREPMLSMTVVGRPNGKTSFGTELFFFTPYSGLQPEDNVFTLNLGLNFYGNFRTKHGKFGVRAGGIHWYNLSPFTIGVYQILDRFSIFDRTPWEGVNNTDKYDEYFKSGATSPGDLRWNNQAFQGLIINGGSLPGEFAFDLFWGKTQPGGVLAGAVSEPQLTSGNTLDAGNVPTYQGFGGLGRIIPNTIAGGRVGRTFDNGKQTLFYNALYSDRALDSIDTDLKQVFQVHTMSLDLNVAKVNIKGELGGGSFKSPTYKERWGEALMLQFFLPKEYTFLPMNLQIYQISKDFYNQNGEIFTQSNPEILQETGIGAGLNGAGAQIAQVNQLVHNRRGVNFNLEYDSESFVVKGGWGLAKEIVANSAFITYVHRVNGLALSRVYNPFPANAVGPTVFGPYARKFSFFRGVSEIMPVTDLDAGTALPTIRKWFTSVDIQAKYRTELFSKKLFFFYLGTFGSASRNAQVIPSLDEESYVLVQYHEFDIYYEVLPKFVLTGYVGFEDARGGRFTQWDEETDLPANQRGTGVGLGFDWTLAENSGLYFRHRFMSFEDKSFSLDKYKGQEITFELKTFF